MNTALLLVDIQNDYFAGGRNPLTGSDEAAAQAAILLSYFRKAGLPLVHIQHVSTRPGAAFFLPNTDGVQIHTAVAPREGETVFQKHFPNSFRDTPLLAWLREHSISRLVVCGMMTHMCIDTTVRAAFDHGFECLIAGDACATKPLTFGGVETAAAEVHRAFLAALNGTFGKVVTAQEIPTMLQTRG